MLTRYRGLLGVGLAMVMATGLAQLPGAPVAGATASARCVRNVDPEPPPASTEETDDTVSDPNTLLPAEAKAAVEESEDQLEKKLAAPAEEPQVALSVGSVTIPVHFHVVTAGPKGRVSRERLHNQIAFLNKAYGGGVNPTHNAPTAFTFELASIEYVDRPEWNNKKDKSPEHMKMKRQLRRGGHNELNIFVVPRIGGEDGTDGYATFPWDLDTAPDVDGVVAEQSIIYGSGDTFTNGSVVAHEVGHWLGLFHTFQGGCDPVNDHVADTPAEKSPVEKGCPESRDTCPDMPGLDPVHNYMTYTGPRCYDRFTPGQAQRAANEWVAWRHPHGSQPLVVADLAVTGTAKGTIKRKGTVTYTYTVTNRGPNPAPNVGITIQAPAQASITKASGKTCKHTKSRMACTRKRLAAGAKATFKITVKISSGAAKGTKLTSQAAVTSVATDPDTTNNKAVITKKAR